MTKIYLQSRLNDFIVLDVEKEEDNNINLEEKGVDVFSKLKNSRYRLI